jgi:hypothetical protein
MTREFKSDRKTRSDVMHAGQVLTGFLAMLAMLLPRRRSHFGLRNLARAVLL